MPAARPRPAAPAAVLAAALLALPLGAPAFAAPGTEGSEKSLVIKDFAFAQPTVKVRVGDTVTWVNNGRTAHLAKAGKKSPVRFESPKLAAGESWSHTFMKAGRYSYLCPLHPGMKATVVALAAPETAAAAEPEPAERTAAEPAAIEQAAASEPIEAQNSAPLLVGSVLFVAAVGLLARARRPAH